MRAAWNDLQWCHWWCNSQEVLESTKLENTNYNFLLYLEQSFLKSIIFSHIWISSPQNVASPVWLRVTVETCVLSLLQQYHLFPPLAFFYLPSTKFLVTISFLSLSLAFSLFRRLLFFSNLPQWQIPHMLQIIRYSHRPARLIPSASITPGVTLLPFTSSRMFFSLIVAVYKPQPPVINGLVLH